MLSFLILVSSSALAVSSSASASVFVPPSYCNVSTDTINDTPHIATINNGTYKEDIGTTTFSVFCGDTGGFSVYAIGYSNNEFGNTKLLANVGGSLSPANDIVTGTGISDTDTGGISNWAMKATPVSVAYTPTIENGFSNYSPIPDTYTKIATFPSVTDTSNGSAFSSTYRAYISRSQPAGTYSGKVRYTLVHPNDAAAPIAKVTLSIAYENAGKTKYNGYYKLQDMTSEICSNTEVLDEAGQTQLIDIRDDKVYWVTKLQDGHCWMTQNLDLDLDSTKTYTPADTDLTGDWQPIRSTINAATDANTTSQVVGWANDSTSPYSVDLGDWYWNNATFYNSYNCAGASFRQCDFMAKPYGTYAAYFSTTPYESNGTHGHVGNTYNWSAAIASNNTASYTNSTYTDVSANPKSSICPAGWRLPTISNQGNVANSTNEFERLNSLYNSSLTNNSAGLEAAPLYLVRAGGVHTGALHGAGFDGVYWSSTASTSGSSYFLYFISNDINTANVQNRLQSYSVRCLAR